MKPREIVRGFNIKRATPRHRWSPPPPTLEWPMHLKSCMWCYTGDVGWNSWDREWVCTCCGWRETEATRAEKEAWLAEYAERDSGKMSRKENS